MGRPGTPKIEHDEAPVRVLADYGIQARRNAGGRVQGCEERLLQKQRAKPAQRFVLAASHDGQRCKRGSCGSKLIPSESWLSPKLWVTAIIYSSLQSFYHRFPAL